MVNPVRDTLPFSCCLIVSNGVNLPEEYRFSSYNNYAKGSPDSIVASNPAYLGLSNSEEARRKQYIDFVVDSSIINSERLSSVCSKNLRRHLIIQMNLDAVFPQNGIPIDTCRQAGKIVG